MYTCGRAAQPLFLRAVAADLSFIIRFVSDFRTHCLTGTVHWVKVTSCRESRKMVKVPDPSELQKTYVRRGGDVR